MLQRQKLAHWQRQRAKVLGHDPAHLTDGEVADDLLGRVAHCNRADLQVRAWVGCVCVSARPPFDCTPPTPLQNTSQATLKPGDQPEALHHTCPCFFPACHAQSSWPDARRSQGHSDDAPMHPKPHKICQSPAPILAQPTERPSNKLLTPFWFISVIARIALQSGGTLMMGRV